MGCLGKKEKFESAPYICLYGNCCSSKYKQNWTYSRIEHLEPIRILLSVSLEFLKIKLKKAAPTWNLKQKALRVNCELGFLANTVNKWATFFPAQKEVGAFFFLHSPAISLVLAMLWLIIGIICGAINIPIFVTKWHLVCKRNSQSICISIAIIKLLGCSLSQVGNTSQK